MSRNRTYFGLFGSLGVCLQAGMCPYVQSGKKADVLPASPVRMRHIDMSSVLIEMEVSQNSGYHDGESP